MSGWVAPYFSPGSARVIRLIVVQSILRVRTPSELSNLRPRSAVLFMSMILWFESACVSERGLGDCAHVKNTILARANMHYVVRAVFV